MSHKFFLSLTALFMCFGTHTIAVAQSELPDLIPLTAEQLQALNNMPSVELYSLQIPQKTFVANDKIAGTITIKNDKDYNLSGLTYKMMLIGEYKNGVPTAVYNTQISEPFSLDGNESKNIEFTYVVPNMVDGELTLRVQTFTSTGLPLAWADTNVVIEGIRQPLLINDAYIAVDGVNHQLQVGPTLHKESQGKIHVQLVNTTDVPVAIIPHVALFKRTIAGELASEKVLEPIDVAANSTYDFVWDIEHGAPNVYEAQIMFKDSQGVLLAPLLQVRYIIDGPIASIQRINFLTDSIIKDKSFDIEIGYAGKPGDIMGDMSAQSNILELSILATDVTGRQIINYAAPFDFNQGSVMRVVVTPERNAEIVTVVVQAFDDQRNVVATYEETIQKSPVPSSANAQLMYIMVTLISLAAAIVVFVWHRRKNNSTIVPTTLASLFVLFALPGAIHANAVVWTGGYDYFNNPGYATTISLSTPTSTVQPGTDFRIEGTMSTIACNNSPQRVDIYRSSTILTSPDQAATMVKTTYDNGVIQGSGHYTGFLSNIFSLGKNAGNATFTAPTIPGEYYIRLTVNVTLTNQGSPVGEEGNAGSREGYIKFTVPENGQCGLTSDQSFATLPTSNLCSTGTASAVATGESNYTWSCAGSFGGTPAQCSVIKDTSVDGQCGTTVDSCAPGTVLNTPSDTPSQYRWSCQGSGGGSTDICSINKDDANTGNNGQGNFDPYCLVTPQVAQIGTPIVWSIITGTNNEVAVGFDWVSSNFSWADSKNVQSFIYTSETPLSISSDDISALVTRSNDTRDVSCAPARFIDQMIIDIPEPIVKDGEQCTLTWSKVDDSGVCVLKNQQGGTPFIITSVSGSRLVDTRQPSDRYYIECSFTDVVTGQVVDVIDSEYVSCIKRGSLIEI